MPLETNVIYCGDCFKKLKDIPDESIDLIYIDPPFSSNRNYVAFWEEQEKRHFEDRFENVQAYIDYMRPRVKELYRVLKTDGTFYYHCDWHASHYVKMMLDRDDLFGYSHFLNEIVWCYRGGGSSKKDFGKRHDIILRYSKTNNYNFYPDTIRIPYQAEGIGRTDDAMWGKHKGTDTVYKPNPLGKIPEDWWLMNILNANDPERKGYPTQKPESLLARIIKASSKNGDIVLDAFCGCGTSIAVAQKNIENGLV